MRLETDYRQWYDARFDDVGPTLVRMAFTRGGLDKREQLAMLERMGLNTPPHGLVRDLARSTLPFGGDSAPWRSEIDCVVYTDELAHRGEGKERMRFAEALERYPDHYASLFIPFAGSEAVNLRHGRIGRIGVWIRQSSKTDWRTNIREQEVAVAREMHAKFPLPRFLWAIDFLPSPYGLLATDFNTAPDLDTAGEGNLVTPEEVFEELELAALERPDHLLQP